MVCIDLYIYIIYNITHTHIYVYIYMYNMYMCIYILIIYQPKKGADLGTNLRAPGGCWWDPSGGGHEAAVEDALGKVRPGLLQGYTGG